MSKKRLKYTYAKGTRLEYEVKRYYEKLGYFVVRQAKSSFPDLIAIGNLTVRFIECKYDGYLPPEDRTRFVDLMKRFATHTFELAEVPKDKHLKDFILRKLDLDGDILVKEVSK